jgi:hypothetical protein
VPETREREIADLRQTEEFLLEHGMRCLPAIPMPQHRRTLDWISRVWWRVKERREALEAADA